MEYGGRMVGGRMVEYSSQVLNVYNFRWSGADSVQLSAFRWSGVGSAQLSTI